MSRPAVTAAVPHRRPPPSLSVEQRRDALARAAEVRRLRAELKAKLKSGAMSMPELLALAGADEDVAGMKVLSVVESLPGLGRSRARRLMEEIGINERRTLRGLGRRQRSQLLDRFPSS